MGGNIYCTHSAGVFGAHDDMEWANQKQAGELVCKTGWESEGDASSCFLWGKHLYE